MSDSDDTDVLLLIPPDLFLVPSSDSDDNSDSASYKKNKSGVVCELIDHMQSLESRISAIESKDSPNNSLNLRRGLSLDSIMSSRQTLPRTKFSVSHNSNLQTTPTKYPQCLSLPSTPSIRQKLHHTNESHRTIKSNGHYQNNASNSNLWNKHANSKLFSEPVYSQTASQNKSLLHVGIGSSEKEPRSVQLPALNVCENNIHNKSYNSLPILNSPSILGPFTSDLKPINDMSLSEVNKLLREIETSANGLIMTNGHYDGQQRQTDLKKPLEQQNYSIGKDHRDKRKVIKLKYSTNDYNSLPEPSYQSDYEKRKDFSDFTLHNDSSFSSFDTEKFISEFKAWSPSIDHDFTANNINITEHSNYEETEKFDSSQQKESSQQISEINAQKYANNKVDFVLENKKDNQQYLDASLISKFADELKKSQTISPTVPEMSQDTLMTSCKSYSSIFKTPSNVTIPNPVDIEAKKSELSNTVPSQNVSKGQSSINTGNNKELLNQKPQRLLTLSDIWNQDSNKSPEEQLRIKLEEERFRREHCEQLIQELQKKLLEQQEKVAVAVRVDNEKNSLISQFQVTWKKMKHRLYELESERENLQKVLKSISDKHQSEIADLQEQIKRYNEELSKALNLATGYKEKSDCQIKEKVDLLKNHADELQSYKSLVQQAESRYEEMKAECQKLLEKNRQTDEALKAVQQDLNKELLKGGEVRTEMTVIHKALDACEAELTILRQEKENLQLKLKEEMSRNNILEQGKISLKAAVDEAKKSEKLAKDEFKSINEQKDKLRAELREVYQKQVDEVVKTKLQEFQTQLDSAEVVFQNEIETKQRAIAECAARKIKSVIDKHQLEINLVEEKHREEKRLYEIKVAQAMQKSAMLEAQLNSYRKSKNQLVEQLHSMLQKQWQQALLIISGGNGENMPSFQKFNVDKLFEIPSEPNLELMPTHPSMLHSEPMKLDSHKSTTSLKNVQTHEHENDSLVTLTSHDETPLTSRQESKSDLRKYIKMILDMQQSKGDYTKPKFFGDSPPMSQKENSNNRSQQSQQKDINTSNEGNSTWQPISEISVHDTSEYLSVPQKFDIKSDQQKLKPPWK